MAKHYKLCARLCVVLSLFTLLAGCYDMHETDDLAYMVALGVDGAEDGQFLYTFQFAMPSRILENNKDENSQSASAESSVTTLTVKAPTFYLALEDTEKSLGKQATFMHLRLIVYAEQLARQGLGEEFMRFMREANLHSNTIFAVSGVSAREYLKSIQPPEKRSPISYYDSVFLSTFKPFLENTKLHKFYYDFAAEGRHAVAAYVGTMEYKDGEGLMLPAAGGDTSDSASKAPLKPKIIGLALFSGTKMVGTADAPETKLYQMITSTFSSSVFTVSDPSDPLRQISARLSYLKDPVYDLKIVNGAPKVGVHLYLTCESLGMPEGQGSGLNTEAYLEAFAAAIKQKTESLLYRTAQEYRADVFGIGKRFRRFFSTWEEWTNYRWDEKYPLSEFQVFVHIRAKTFGGGSHTDIT